MNVRALAPAALALAAILLSAWLKLTVDAGGPLWLDEGWTLGIVERPTWSGFAEQLRLDVNPPLYFVLLRGWTALFGTADATLRAFSTACALLLPAAAVAPSIEARDRWTWAALLALWTSGIAFAQEARGYALLALLSAAQTALFVRLLARPDRARAAQWAVVAGAAALTQHHALLLTALEGLALVAWERTRVLRLWPAALALLPALVWDVLQAPRIALFSRPEYAWYPRFGPSLAEAAGETLAGAWPVALGALAMTAAAAAVTRARANAPAPFARAEGAAWTAAATSVAGGLLLIAIGALKPSLAPRYLAPFAPGALLLPVLALQGAAGRPRAAARVGVVLLFAAGALTASALADTPARRAYQFETASADLVRAGAQRVAFLWDNPTDAALSASQRDALGDAFFARARHPVRIDGMVLRPGEDPNAVLAAATADGLIWLYDLRVPHTAAARLPPRLEAADPRLRCRRYAGGALGVVACVRSPLRWPT